MKCNVFFNKSQLCQTRLVSIFDKTSPVSFFGKITDLLDKVEITDQIYIYV